MANGQTAKHLSNNEDCVFITFHPYGEMIMVNDKLYASKKIADKTGGRVVKITKAMLIELDKLQNGAE